MTKLYTTLAASGVALLMLAGCGDKGGDEQTAAEQAADETEGAMEQMGQEADQMMEDAQDTMDEMADDAGDMMDEADDMMDEGDDDGGN